MAGFCRYAFPFQTKNQNITQMVTSKSQLLSTSGSSFHTPAFSTHTETYTQKHTYHFPSLFLALRLYLFIYFSLFLTERRIWSLLQAEWARIQFYLSVNRKEKCLTHEEPRYSMTNRTRFRLEYNIIVSTPNRTDYRRA